ncbi:amidohydrolase [Pseudonocardia sp. N23]|uniref:amidohydrolase n=1 Tax=Pseudonocardia sp. N23 TaxID=1987376 RepID=UPI000BFE1816|nr:amidohydrolase family protein [Pseudonocardia sp. N23]GAY10743.1 exoenzymes regulatory protein AepA in lipid-linked oligosaccharide synthesis cluster [Pseudonocardia sp. N23]
MRSLLVGVRILDPAGPSVDGPAAVETDGDTITWVGPAAGAAGRAAGAQVLDVPGTTLTPTFVDAHVHATSSGLLLDGLDLGSCRSAAQLLDALAAHASVQAGDVVWGHGWAEDDWADPTLPSRAAIDRAAGGRPTYLTRVDVHSALVSSALVDRARDAVDAAGWSGSGPLSADAHHHVRRAALATVGRDQRDQRDRAQRSFLAAAARAGIGTVHECAGPLVSGREDLAALLMADAGVDVVGYWGEAVDSARDARALLAATGAHGLAGDLFVDGSLGSRTAALRSPYVDADHCGRTFVSADAVAAHLVACSAAGVQAGFHAIGDAAIDRVLDGLVASADAVPVQMVRDARHRIEHLEMPDPDRMALLADLGVVASVQPAFDAAWGGTDRLYAARLGAERAAGMNPYAALHAAGVVLAFGSDSPVTALDPWGAVRAAAAHRTPGSGVDAGVAFAAHVTGGHHAARSTDPSAGRIVAGAPAGLALWDGDPTAGDAADGAVGRCLRTVQRGRTVFDALAGDGRVPLAGG